MSMGGLGGGFGLRTIWITLRAINYTERVFGDVIKSISGLIGKELELTKVGEEQIRSITRLIQAGTLFVTLAQMSAQNMLNWTMATKVGADEMENLTAAMEDTKIAIADTFYEVLKGIGILDALRGTLQAIQENKALQLLVFGFLTLAVAVTGIIGSYFLFLALSKSIAFWSLVLIGRELTLSQMFTLLAAKVGLADISMKKLAISTALALGVFGAVFAILKDMHPAISAAIAIILALAAAFIKLYIAESFATLGVAAIAGAAGATIATGYAMAHGFQQGTRSAPYTGLAMVHRGEVIYNPATGSPTQVGNELGQERSGVTYQQVKVKIDNVNTRADIEDLDEKLSRGLRRGMRANR